MVIRSARLPTVRVMRSVCRLAGNGISFGYLEPARTRRLEPIQPTLTAKRGTTVPAVRAYAKHSGKPPPGDRSQGPAVHCRVSGTRRPRAAASTITAGIPATKSWSCMQDIPVPIRSQDSLYKQSACAKPPLRSTLGAPEERGWYAVSLVNVDRAERKPYAFLYTRTHTLHARTLRGNRPPLTP